MSDEIRPGGAPGRPQREEGKPVWLALLVVLVILGLPAYGIFTWFFCRIEVPPAHVLVLVAKTGDDLPSGEVVATEAGQKGIQLETLKPGRHFRNPLFWDWEVHPFVDIKQGQVGVLTRLYGQNPEDLSANLLVPKDTAGGHLKGIVDEVIRAGQYPINPYAYRVDPHPRVHIPAGYVGVVCNRVGAKPKTGNTYLVEPGERGVQKAVLRQGDHYLNPWAVQVYPVDVRSHRLELAGEKGNGGEQKGSSSLKFPSNDGFEIEVHLTVEWSIDEARAPEVFVRIGAGDPKTLHTDVLQKTLIPAIRGEARIEGSKYPATDYIRGESRTLFQQAIDEQLRVVCKRQGIIIHSVLVNDIVPPQDIAGPIREREVAREELTRNKIQEQQAKAEQSLARETALVVQEKAKVLAETEKEKQRIAAENDQRVALIGQERMLAVAEADLVASRLEAQAILARGKAEAAVIVANNQAETEALRTSVSAFETPSLFATYTFAQRMAPSVQSVFADPDGPFGQLFKDLLESASKGGAQ